MSPAYSGKSRSGSQASPGPSCARLNDVEHASYGAVQDEWKSSLNSASSSSRVSELPIDVAVVGNTWEGPDIDGLEGRDKRKDGRTKAEGLSMGKYYSPYLKLENSGNVARDHLASERTFLAYVRTSLAIASCGVALVEFFTTPSLPGASARAKINLQQFARPLGAIVVTIGMLVLFIGSTRYFRVQAALIVGKFPPARHAIMLISAILVVIISAVFGILAGVTG